MRGFLPSHAVIWVATVISAVPARVHAQGTATLTGRVTVAERGNKAPTDIGQAVIWLEGAGLRPAPVKPLSVLTESKEFRPRVSVVATGTTVVFPNNDPFNHNVFSLSEEAKFDLGLYGRGQSMSARFTRPGVVRIFCNVHATMAAFVVVRDNAFFAQPSADGTFTLSGVPAGKYALRAWHERAPQLVREIEVTTAGVNDIQLQFDARGYRFVQHLNKFGQPYSKGGARY